MSKSYLRLGSWNAICDRCGRKFKAYQLRRTWDGLMVCEDDWETRHPQELLRTVKDTQKLPWTKPEASDTFVESGNLCTLSGRTPVVGAAIVGCAVVYPRYQAIADLAVSDISIADDLIGDLNYPDFTSIVMAYTVPEGTS